MIVLVVRLISSKEVNYLFKVYLFSTNYTQSLSKINNINGNYLKLFVLFLILKVVLFLLVSKINKEKLEEFKLKERNKINSKYLCIN